MSLDASTSPFNISKASSEVDRKVPPTRAGRDATTALAPGIHGAVAGRRGRKLRSAGNELGGNMLGSIAGGAVGGLTRNAALGAAAAQAGGIGGSIAGGRRNERRGYLKESVGKGLSPLAETIVKRLLPEDE